MIQSKINTAITAHNCNNTKAASVPDLSIIIVNWNTSGLLNKCLQSLYDFVTGIDFEIIVVDNGSVDDSIEMVRKIFPDVQLIANLKNIGFVRANNQAIYSCYGRNLLLLNSDTVILPDSMIKAVQFMDENSNIGISGVKILNSDGSFQASFNPFPTLLREFYILSGLGRWLIRSCFPSYGPQSEKGPQKVNGYVEGACLMVRRAAMDAEGMLDERIFMYAEEVDLCYRFIQVGWEVWYLPQASIIHHGGESSKKQQGKMEAELYRSRVYFFHKHYGKASALRLEALIYIITTVKMFYHKLLQILSNGKRGRGVSTWKELRTALKSSVLK